MASSIQATRLRKGMLIKVGNDLFRILDLHHLTPGQQARAHPGAGCATSARLTLADHKFRAEEDVERATLDEREMQYLYNDGDHYYFMDTSTYEQIHISAEALGDSKNYLIADIDDPRRVLRRRAGRHRTAADGRSRRQGNGARHQRRDGQRAGEAGDARDRPRRAGAAVRQRRRQDPRQHRDRANTSRGSERQQSDRWKSSATQPHHGWIEVITGSMFSGKSEELIRRLRRAQIARQKVQIFKPLIDDRFSDDHIVSHSDMRIASQNVTQLRRAGPAGATTTPKSSASTKGSSSTPTCRPRATRSRTAASG